MDNYTDATQGPVNFPSRDVPDSEKNGAEYNLKYARAMYNMYRHDKCGVLYSIREYLDLIRLYGKGAQPKSLYKNFNNEKSSTDTDTSSFSINSDDKTRKGWENIAQKVISPLPRIKTIIKGYLDQVGQTIAIDTLDPMSNDMKQNIKWRMYAISQNYEFMSEYHLKAGIPMEELEFAPANVTELNIFESMGGFKLNFAKAMEKLIRHTENISDFDEYLKDKWLDDAIDLGVMAGREVFGHTIGKFKYAYIDPKYLVMQYVRNDDYTKSEYAGYIERYTVSELKQLLPDKPEEFFKNTAFRYRGLHGNRGSGMGEGEWDNFSKHNKSSNSYSYDNFLVEVMEVEWIDYEWKRNLIYVNKYGHKSSHPLGRDSEVDLTEASKKRGSKDLKTKMRKLRKAKYVIGTEVVFDYGLVNMTDRPTKSTVMHSFKLFTLLDMPITEQLIPIADDMALAWYRYQDDRANLQRAGYAVDVSMMENIQMGGKDFEFTDVLKAWRETRYLFHQQSMSGKYEGGNTSPVQPIPSMMLDALNEFVVSWDAAMKRIGDITGLNVDALVAATAPSTSATATQMAASSAVNTLKPIINLLGKIQKELAEVTMRRLQLAVKTRPDIVKNYESVVGKADLEALKMAEKLPVQYGMEFEDKPTPEMIEEVMQAATASLQARRDGKPGIDLSQFMYVRQQLDAGGNMKELIGLIEYLGVKAEKQQNEQQQQAIQMQSQGVKEAKQIDIQGQMAVEDQKTKNQILIDKKKSENNIQEMLVEQGAQQNATVAP